MNKLRRVLRYPFKVADEVITLPAGPVVLVTPSRTFAGPGELDVWIESSVLATWPHSAALGKQDILVVRTGAEVPVGAVHLDSVLDGPMVWHLYRLCTCEYEEIYAAPGCPEDLVRRVRTDTANCPIHAEQSPAAEDLETVEVHEAEDLEHAIEVMATDLWEADPGNKTPARTFGEDYAATQDRYRAMATAILAPEPVEPETKR